MSTLAAARADNFYYPLSFDPKRHKSLNKFQKSHPLRERAKWIKEGILIIRFEMPFKVVCMECDRIIDKGVRFNAEKKCVGNYFSTKIYEFSMKCRSCSNILKIVTDPQHAEYKITHGLRLKVETYSAEDAEVIEYNTEHHPVTMDPIQQLEKKQMNQKQFESSTYHLSKLITLQNSRSGDEEYYNNNYRLRKQFREKKASDISEEKKNNTGFPLLPASSKDEDEAKSVVFREKPFKKKQFIKESKIKGSSIFSTENKNPSVVFDKSKSCEASPVSVVSTKWPGIQLLMKTKPVKSLIANSDLKKKNYSSLVGHAARIIQTRQQCS